MDDLNADLARWNKQFHGPGANVNTNINRSMAGGGYGTTAAGGGGGGVLKGSSGIGSRSTGSSHSGGGGSSAAGGVSGGGGDRDPGYVYHASLDDEYIARYSAQINAAGETERARL